MRDLNSDVEGFLRGVWILSSFNVHSTEIVFRIYSCFLCKKGRAWCRNGKKAENSNRPIPFFVICRPSSCIFWLKMPPMHTLFTKNELHQLHSTSSIVLPFPIDVLERQMPQFLLGVIFLTWHLSRVTQSEWFVKYYSKMEFCLKSVLINAVNF